MAGTKAAEKNLEQIDAAIGGLMAALQALEMVRRGRPLAEAAKAAGASVGQLSRVIRQGGAWKAKGRESMEGAEENTPSTLPTLNGAERLFSTVVGGAALEDIPSDVEETVRKAIGSVLNGREKKVIRMRFWQGMTLEECGRALGVGMERVRQIEAKALRKLRRPGAYQYLSRGDRWYRRKREEAAERDRRHWEEKAAEAAALKKRALTDYWSFARAAEKAFSDEEEAGQPEWRSILLDDMELSVRSHNCLRRGGYKTAGDIWDKGISGLMKTRNLGGKSLAEIQKAVEALAGGPLPEEGQE